MTAATAIVSAVPSIQVEALDSLPGIFGRLPAGALR